MTTGVRVLTLVVITGQLLGCGQGEPVPEVEAHRSALGVPVNGYPNHDERVILFMTNRMRAAPQAFEKWFNKTSTRTPSPPVAYAQDLNHAARWQANHQEKDGCPLCKDHSSCCKVGEVGGVVKCVGPVTGCGVTSYKARIALFSKRGGITENAAAGTSSGERALFAWLMSGGHWDNINKSKHRVLGPGAMGKRHLQVFGGGSEPRPVAALGSHFLRRIFLSAYSSKLQDVTKPSFGQVYYAPTGSGPKIAMVVVEGVCHKLKLAYGKANHGSYEKEIQLPVGCHRYVFHVRDSAGKDHVYPHKGSLMVAVKKTCKEYDPVRPKDSCSPSGNTKKQDAGGTKKQDAGGTNKHDAGGTNKHDAGGTKMQDAGGSGQEGGGGFIEGDGLGPGVDAVIHRANRPGAQDGCSVAATGAPGSTWLLSFLSLLSLLSLLVLWRRRRSA